MSSEFSEFFGACRDAMLIVTPSGQIIQANAPAEVLFGFKGDQLAGQSARRLFPGQSLGLRPEQGGPGVDIQGVDIQGVDTQRCCELVGQRADASQFPAEVQVIPVTTAQGPAAVLAIRDITEQQRAAFVLELGLDVLHAADREREALLGHLIRAQEDERARIAAAIHDDTIQVLTAASLQAGQLRLRLRDPGPLQILARLERTLTLSMARLRQLIFDLRPVVADNGGVTATLRAYLDDMHADTGITYHLDDTRTAQATVSANTIIYRTAREALTNVRKHAQARTVRVQLLDVAHGLLARITDDGIGYSPADVEDRAGHLGLILMRERVQTAGGWCRIESAPGAGTTVEFWVPLTIPAGQRKTGNGRAA
jgi:PAS domain S-box-containing protein